MHDRNGREIKVGHLLATPYPKPKTARDEAYLPTTIKDAVLGTVIEILTVPPYEEEALAHLGDGVLYEGSEVVTMGRLEWLTCPECGTSWVFDLDSEEKEECPSCGALLNLEGEEESE